MRQVLFDTWDILILWPFSSVFCYELVVNVLKIPSHINYIETYWRKVWFFYLSSLTLTNIGVQVQFWSFFQMQKYDSISNASYNVQSRPAESYSSGDIFCIWHSVSCSLVPPPSSVRPYNHITTHTPQFSLFMNWPLSLCAGSGASILFSLLSMFSEITLLSNAITTLYILEWALLASFREWFRT